MSKPSSRFTLHIISILDGDVLGPYAIMLVDNNLAGVGDNDDDSIVAEGLVAYSKIVIEADCEDFNWSIDYRSVPLDLFDKWFTGTPYLGSDWVAIKTKFRAACAQHLLEVT